MVDGDCCHAYRAYQECKRDTLMDIINMLQEVKDNYDNDPEECPINRDTISDIIAKIYDKVSKTIDNVTW